MIISSYTTFDNTSLLGGEGFLHSVLVGKLIDGQVDFGQSFELLSTGLFIPFGAVLPYVFAFYLVLSLLEDFGYLPRLGVLVDNVMHRVGLHGLSIIPMMLGLGCNVPGGLASRILETRKERFIACTLLAICVPCMAQIAMVAGLLGKFGAAGFLPVFGTLFGLWLLLDVLMKKFVKGEAPEILIDIPPYRMPYWKSLLQKLWMRMKWFVKEAVPYVLLGVFIVNLFYSLGIIKFLSKAFSRGLSLFPLKLVGSRVHHFMQRPP